MKFLIALFAIVSAYAGTGAIPSGPNIKLLKDNLVFKNTYTRIMTNDSDDPTSVAKEADIGSIYIKSDDGVIYKKTDSGLSTNWEILGGITGTGTDNCIARWDGTGTALLQDSVICATDTGDITGVNSQLLNSIAAPTYTEGLLFYDSTNTALSYYNDEADVTVNIGQELLIKVRNASGSTIVNGAVVYLSNAVGNRPTIELAQSDSRATLNSIGVATHDIENNSDGYITILGEINDLDTSSFTSGDALYVSPTVAGAFTNVRPSYPNYVVEVGTVQVSNPANGSILVETDDVASAGGTDTYVRYTRPNGFFGEEAGFTYTEGTDTLAVVNVDATSLDGGNLNVSANTLSSTDTNGNLILDPNGTGNVQLPDLTVSQPAYIDASGNLISQDIDLTTDVSGVLPLANGGTGSSSIADTGVVFSNGTTLLADAATFFWDNTGKVLSIVGQFVVDTFTFDGSDIASTADITISPLNKLTVNGGIESVSTTDSSLPCPRMTNAQMVAITPASSGYCVYNTTYSSQYRYDGTKWVNAADTRDLRIFYQNNYESGLASSDFSCFDGGVIGAGSSVTTFIDADAATPLDGTTSLEITQPASGAGYYCLQAVGQEIDVPLYAQSGDIQLRFPSTYDGASGDMSIFLWDDTNSQVVVDGSGNDVFLELRTGFVSNSLNVTLDGTEQLRWGVIINTANTGAIALLDNLEILANPNANIDIYASSEPVEYITSINNITIGNGSISTFWERNGRYMTITAEVTLGSTSNITGQVSIPLPSGYEVDTTKGNAVNLITGNIRDISGNSNGLGYAQLRNSTNVWVSYLRNSTIFDVVPIDATSPFTWTGGDGFNVRFSVPILGWKDKEDNVIVAGTDNVLLTVEGEGSSGDTITSANNINFLEIVDNKNAWSGTTLTAPRDGTYYFSGMVTFTTSGSRGVKAVINSGEYEKALAGIITDFSHKFEGSIKLNAGDIVQIRLDSGSGTLSTSTKYHYINIQEFPSEELIYAYLDESSISLKYARSVSQVILNAASNTIAYNVEQYNLDDPANYSAAGVYTAAVSGVYSIKAKVAFSSTFAGTKLLTINVNGTGASTLVNTTASVTQFEGSDDVFLNAGDTLEIDFFQNSGSSQNTSTGVNSNSLAIHRIR